MRYSSRSSTTDVASSESTGELGPQLRAAPTWARCGLGLALAAPLLACAWLPPLALLVAGSAGFVMFAAGGRDLIASSGRGVSVVSVLLVALPFVGLGALVAFVRNAGDEIRYFQHNEWTEWTWYFPAALMNSIGIELAARRPARMRLALVGALGGGLLLAAMAPFANLLAIF